MPSAYSTKSLLVNLVAGVATLGALLAVVMFSIGGSDGFNSTKTSLLQLSGHVDGQPASLTVIGPVHSGFVPVRGFVGHHNVAGYVHMRRVEHTSELPQVQVHTTVNADNEQDAVAGATGAAVASVHHHTHQKAAPAPAPVPAPKFHEPSAVHLHIIINKDGSVQPGNGHSLSTSDQQSRQVMQHILKHWAGPGGVALDGSIKRIPQGNNVKSAAAPLRSNAALADSSMGVSQPGREGAPNMNQQATEASDAHPMQNGMLQEIQDAESSGRPTGANYASMLQQATQRARERMLEYHIGRQNNGHAALSQQPPSKFYNLRSQAEQVALHEHLMPKQDTKLETTNSQSLSSSQQPAQSQTSDATKAKQSRVNGAILKAIEALGSQVQRLQKKTDALSAAGSKQQEKLPQMPIQRNALQQPAQQEQPVAQPQHVDLEQEVAAEAPAIAKKLGLSPGQYDVQIQQ